MKIAFKMREGKVNRCGVTYPKGTLEKVAAMINGRKSIPLVVSEPPYDKDGPLNSCGLVTNAEVTDGVLYGEATIEPSMRGVIDELVRNKVKLLLNTRCVGEVNPDKTAEILNIECAWVDLEEMGEK